MRNPYNMSHEELAFIVSNVQGILWMDTRGDDNEAVWTPDKEQNGDFLEDISQVLEMKGLKPKIEGEKEEEEFKSKGCELLGCDESENPCKDCHIFPQPKQPKDGA